MRIVAFLVLAYGFSWAVWLIPALAPVSGLAAYGPAIAALIVAYRPGERTGGSGAARLLIFAVAVLVGALVFDRHLPTGPGPQRLASPWLAAMPALIPAWILSAARSRNRGVRELAAPLLRGSGWAVVAFFAFALYLLLPAALARATGGALVPAVAPLATPRDLVQLAGALAFTFLFAGGLSEEPGWRGLLLPALLRRWSPLSASVLVWLAWALWHAPLDLRGWAGATVGAYLFTRAVLLLPLTILTTWLYRRSGGSVLTTAVFHTTFNALPPFLPSVPGSWWLLYLGAAAAVIADRMWRKADCDAPALPARGGLAPASSP